jgi:hypothetical protein
MLTYLHGWIRFGPPINNYLFALDPSTSLISFEHDVEFQNLLPQATWTKRLEILTYPRSRQRTLLVMSREKERSGALHTAIEGFLLIDRVFGES